MPDQNEKPSPEAPVKVQVCETFEEGQAILAGLYAGPSTFDKPATREAAMAYTPEGIEPEEA